MRLVIHIALLFIVLWAPDVQCGELPSTQELQSLPFSYGGVVPRLGVDWSANDANTLGFVITLHTERNVVIYNPYSESIIGSAYQIILTTQDGHPMWGLLDLLPANQSVPDPTAWVRLPANRIFGRRFWRHRDWTLASDDLELQRTPPPKFPAGDYLMHLVVARRLVTEPPFQENPKTRSESQTLWRAPDLNALACRAQPVAVTIGADGKIQKPIHAKSIEDDSRVRVNTSLVDDHMLVEAIIFARQECWSRDPGFQLSVGFNRESAISIGIDGIDHKDPIHLFNSVTSFSGAPPSVKDIRRIPKDGILGFRQSYGTKMIQGKYHVTVTFSRRLWCQGMDDFTPDNRFDTEAKTMLFEVKSNSSGTP